MRTNSSIHSYDSTKGAACVLNGRIAESALKPRRTKGHARSTKEATPVLVPSDINAFVPYSIASTCAVPNHCLWRFPEDASALGVSPAWLPRNPRLPPNLCTEKDWSRSSATTNLDRCGREEEGLLAPLKTTCQ